MRSDERLPPELRDPQSREGAERVYVPEPVQRAVGDVRDAALVVRAALAAPDPRVGIDGARCPQNGLDLALRLAQEARAPVVVVRVDAEPMSLFSFDSASSTNL